MGDEEEGDADVALDRLELHLHLLAQLEVEGAERLVEEEHARPVDQGAGEGDPLALAARELAGAAAAEVTEAHLLERVHGPLATLGPADLLDPQAVLDVLDDAHVREEGVVLEDGVDVACVGRRGVTSSPPSWTVPAVGVSNPAIIRSTVVLPEPDGPSIEKNSPSAMDRSMSSTATTGGAPANSLRKVERTTAAGMSGV